MANVSVTMDGLAELQKKLKTFARTEEITNVALEKAGEHLRSSMAELVPVDKGDLKKAIIKGEVVDGKILIGPSQQGPDFRAHFVEFGTKFQQAQPFMRPAFESEKSKIEKIMAEEIRKGLGL